MKRNPLRYCYKPPARERIVVSKYVVLTLAATIRIKFSQVIACSTYLINQSKIESQICSGAIFSEDLSPSLEPLWAKCACLKRLLGQKCFWHAFLAYYSFFVFQRQLLDSFIRLRLLSLPSGYVCTPPQSNATAPISLRWLTWRASP